MNETICVYTSWKNRAVRIEILPEYAIDFNSHCIYGRWVAALRLTLSMSDVDTGEIIKARAPGSLSR